MTVGKVKNFNFSSGGMTKGHTKDFTFSSDSKSKAKGYADGGSPKPQATSPSPTRGLGGRPLPIMQRPLPVPQQSSIGGRDKPDDYDRDGSNARSQAMKLARQQERFGGGMQRPGGPINTLPMPPQQASIRNSMQPNMSQDQMQQALLKLQQGGYNPANGLPAGSQQGLMQQGGGMPPPGLAGLGQQAMQQAQFSGNPVAGGGMGGQQNQANQLQQMYNQQSQAGMGQQAMPGGMGGGIRPGMMPPPTQSQPSPDQAAMVSQLTQAAKQQASGMPGMGSQSVPPAGGGMAKPMGYAKGGKVMGKVAAAPQGMIKNRGTLGVVGNKNPGETKMNTAPNLPGEKMMMNKGGKAMMGGGSMHAMPDGKMMKNSAMKKGGMAKSNKNC